MNSFFYHRNRQFSKKEKISYFYERKYCVQPLSIFKINNRVLGGYGMIFNTACLHFGNKVHE